MSTRRSSGRPPRGRERRVYMPTLEQPLYALLEEAAARAGQRPNLVASIIVAEALGERSPWDPELDFDQLGVDIDNARRVAQTIEPFPSAGGNRRNVYVRLDEPLAGRFSQRCDALDISYAESLRRILAAAWGLDRHELIRLDRQAGTQERLPIAEAS